MRSLHTSAGLDFTGPNFTCLEKRYFCACFFCLFVLFLHWFSIMMNDIYHLHQNYQTYSCFCHHDHDQKSLYIYSAFSSLPKVSFWRHCWRIFLANRIRLLILSSPFKIFLENLDIPDNSTVLLPTRSFTHHQTE